MAEPRPIDPGVDIGHVHLKVADLDRALDFYCGVLGFELQQRIRRRGGLRLRRRLSPPHRPQHLALEGRPAAAARAAPASSTWRSATRPARALADALRRLLRGRAGARRRLRPRGQRGALPQRPRRQRRRALLGPPARAVAAICRRRGPRDVHAPPRSRRPRSRAGLAEHRPSTAILGDLARL